MLAAYFMRNHGERHHGDGWLMQRYTRLLDWSVHHRLAAVAIGIGILAVSVASTTFLSFGFMPGEDANRILIAAELPPGSRLADMDKASSEISKIVCEPWRSDERVRHRRTHSGGRGRGEEVRKATLIVNLTDKAKRSVTQRQLEQAISAELQQLPDVRTWILKDNGERDASFVVSGPDNAAVTQTAARIASQMQQRARSGACGDELGAGQAGTALPPAPRRGRGTGRIHGGAVRGDPHRHHRRHQRQPAQVQRWQPAGSDPRAAG